MYNFNICFLIACKKLELILFMPLFIPYQIFPTFQLNLFLFVHDELSFLSYIKLTMKLKHQWSFFLWIPGCFFIFFSLYVVESLHQCSWTFDAFSVWSHKLTTLTTLKCGSVRRLLQDKFYTRILKVYDTYLLRYIYLVCQTSVNFLLANQSYKKMIDYFDSRWKAKPFCVKFEACAWCKFVNLNEKRRIKAVELYTK